MPEAPAPYEVNELLEALGEALRGRLGRKSQNACEDLLRAKEQGDYGYLVIAVNPRGDVEARFAPGLPSETRQVLGLDRF